MYSIYHIQKIKKKINTPLKKKRNEKRKNRKEKKKKKENINNKF